MYITKLFFLNFFNLKSNECINFINLSSNLRIYTNKILLCDIKNCFFQRINNYIGLNNSIHSSDLNNSNIHGGIIYIFEIGFNFSIKNSVFYNCSTYGDGGAIYYESNNINSRSFLSKICIYNCFTNKNSKYQFCLISIFNDLKNENYFNDISILKCSNNINNGKISIGLNNGNITLFTLNSTINKVQSISCFNIKNALNFSSYYCNIINNSVLDHSCLFLENSNLFYLRYSNFILNNSPNKGIISLFNGIYNLSGIIIYSNFNQIFYLENSKLYLYLIYLNDTFIENKNIITSQFFLNFTNTFSLNHYNTFLCITYDEYINIIPTKTQINNEEKNNISNLYKKIIFGTIIFLILSLIGIFFLLYYKNKKNKYKSIFNPLY